MADQTGRVAVVTGANSGIGYEAAKALALGGATVVLAVRNVVLGAEAEALIRAARPAAKVEVWHLDLASLAAVRSFAEGFAEQHDALHLLINNAGVMMPPRTETVDGFELQLGVNHLGHFALTGLLLERLLGTSGSRIVNVASSAHQWGKIDFDDLHWQRRRYRRMEAYGQSKVANLLFTYELHRRLEAAGASTLAVAAHPGWTATNLQRTTGLARAVNPLLAMKPWQGALPTLYAATAGDVRGGDYFGPGGWLELRGYPERVQSSAYSHNPAVAARLWRVSEELTGVRYDRLPAAS